MFLKLSPNHIHLDVLLFNSIFIMAVVLMVKLYCTALLKQNIVETGAILNQ